VARTNAATISAPRLNRITETEEVRRVGRGRDRQ